MSERKIIGGFAGNPIEQAQRLRELADRCEAGEIRFVTVAVLEQDGSTGFMHSGVCSFIESIGLWDLAKDTAYTRSREGW